MKMSLSSRISKLDREMKNYIFTISVIILLCFGSCKDNEVAYFNRTILLEKVVSTDSNESFSDMGYQVEKRMLIFPDSIFISGNSHVVFVSQVDSSIFATDGKYIFRFDKEGKFRNRIGILGHGPMEYQNIFNSSFDTNEENVYLHVGNGKIYVFSFDGLPVDVVELESDGYIGGAYRLKDGFWAETLSYENGKNTISIIIFNNNGKKRDEIILASFDAGHSPDYYPYPIVNQQGNLVYDYYSPYTSQLYNISSEGIKNALTVKGGKFSIEGDKINDMDYKTDNRNRFVEILDIHNSEDAVYLLYTIGRKVYAGILDKTSGKCVFNGHINNPVRGGGIQISENSDIKTWPHCIWRNNIYSISYEQCNGGSNSGTNENALLLILISVH